MKKTTLLFAALAVLFLWLPERVDAQGWTARLIMLQDRFIPGEPLIAMLELENTSTTALPNPGTGDFFLDGAQQPCRPRDLPMIQVPSYPPGQGALTTPQQTGPLDAPGTIHRQEINFSYWCNMEIGAASLIGRHRLCFRPSAPSLVSPSDVCRSFEIVAPQGVDKTVWKALPPRLRDMLHDASLVKVNLLANFPTSTYAGYALAHSAPTLTTMESLACLNDVNAALRRYGNRGGGEANTQGHILEAQNEMRAYAKAAGAFLGAHPDFVYAPQIRRMYAMCLGLTGHMPGAMAEIQTLSTESGKEAAEAQAFLAEKAAAEPKS